jgi:FkbM family methyltransferase
MKTVNRIIRKSGAQALRRLPVAIPGKGRLARIVNNLCPPDPFHSKVWARMRLGHEMLVDLRSFEFQAYYTGDYDNDAIRTLQRLLAPNTVFVDVGANIGFWTVPLGLSLSRQGGVIHSFEPVPANFLRLAENVNRNSLNHVAKLHQVGLSDQNGTARISLREDFARGAETGNAALFINAEDERFPSTSVNIARLDDLFDSLGICKVDLMKVDIEGHEDKFLAGADETIQRFRPIIYMEINEPYYERRGLDPTQIFETWLHSQSYSAALKIDGTWSLQTIRKRRRVIDNVILIPAEKDQDTMRRLAC